MKAIQTKIPGVLILEPVSTTDERGGFVKIFHEDTHRGHGLSTHFEEVFHSTSRKGVIRGMHLQVPPKEYSKVVFVTQGRVLDVVLDLRKGSPTYKEYVAEELSAENRRMVYIPAGCAHGFVALEDDSLMMYLQTRMHSPEHDVGIHAHSFGFDWGEANPIMSTRDKSLPLLDTFDSPFIYEDLS